MPKYRAGKPITEEVLQSSVAELGLPNRLYELLDGEGIHTIQQLLYCCPREIECRHCDIKWKCTRGKRLLSIKQVGEGSLDDIRQAFVNKGWFVRVDSE